MATILAFQAPGGGATALIFQLVIIVAIFYFILILPQRREAKRHREMLAALKPGDEIVTAGGLVGEIIQLREDVVNIKSGDSRLVIERARIARKRTPDAK